MTDQKGKDLVKVSVHEIQSDREDIAGFTLARAVDVAESILGVPKPGTPTDGFGGDDVVLRGEMLFASRGYIAQFDSLKLAVGNALAWIGHTLSLPHRLKLTSGSTTLIADFGRRDLLETLLKLQALLGDDKQMKLCIVKEPATIEEATRYRTWSGTVFEFRPVYNPGAITAEYLAWHPSADYEPRDRLAAENRYLCKIGRVEHRAAS